jgi:hypothetical protein
MKGAGWMRWGGWGMGWGEGRGYSGCNEGHLHWLEREREKGGRGACSTQTRRVTSDAAAVRPEPAHNRAAHERARELEHDTTG